MSRPSVRALVEQHRKDIRDLFAERLAERLGRKAVDIRNDGLSARDFKSNERIDLVFCDGSTMSFGYAFAVVDTDQRVVGVFTEHCGYYFFRTAGLRVREFRDERIVGEHSW